MSKKSADTFQQKISRNDRFAQMSHQEKVIEQKKREILAKLEAKEKSKSDHSKSKSENPKQGSKSGSNTQKEVKNIFSNDGSFLDQFKQLKEKKLDLKLKSFGHSKDYHDKNHSDERSKLNRWTPRRRSPSPKDRPQKRNFSRFSSDKVINFEQKITINTSFSSTVTQQPQTFDISTSLQPISVTPQDVTGQPLLKNLLPASTITYPEIIQQTASEAVITAPPVLIDVPPPQIVQAPQINSTLVLTETPQVQQSVLVSTPLQPILTTVNLPPPLVTANVNVSPQTALPVPPPCLPTVELASIPPPNPIQVQNIPQPEPINALNIPQPAPIQVQNIPTPNSIQLNEIPNPKPLDLLTIPTPNEDKSLSDADFIKNIPPPNKSVPPPQLQETTVSLISAAQTVSSITVPSPQNVLVHNVPPPAQIQTIQTPTNQILQPQSAFSSVAVALPVGVVQVTSTPPAIPSLMAQPILPPPGMGLNVNVNCPPPLLPAGNGLQAPITAFINQVGQPNTVGQMPTMNLPPPGGVHVLGALGPVPSVLGLKNMNAVFPPGSPEYESMASLGRMVAECGQSIEDIVRQRKNQDPNLWFLFHKESAAYQQYRQLIEQMRQENEIKKKMEEATAMIKNEDIYEPEKALEESEDVRIKFEFKEEVKEDGLDSNERKRKKKSRWGEKELNVAPPVVIYNQPGINMINPAMMSLPPQSNQGSLMLSKVTRNDSGLIQYAINTYGSANLSEEDWKKAEDNYKINILYQDMIKKREEVERLKITGKNKYEYDSDEETEGGTWEHKAREKEMVATELWAQELTRQAEGKHHIGDFLPPEELKRFMEKSSAVKEGRQPSFSDYKEFKIKEDNIGFKMLQKLGWTEGQGLGSGGTGIIEPVSKAPQREHTQGLGLNEIEEDEDEYESYRKRMMLAYRFRPNPLNNPRRPYY